MCSSALRRCSSEDFSFPQSLFCLRSFFNLWALVTNHLLLYTGRSTTALAYNPEVGEASSSTSQQQQYVREHQCSDALQTASSVWWQLLLRDVCSGIQGSSGRPLASSMWAFILEYVTGGRELWWKNEPFEDVWSSSEGVVESSDSDQMKKSICKG